MSGLFPTRLKAMLRGEKFLIAHCALVFSVHLKEQTESLAKA